MSLNNSMEGEWFGGWGISALAGLIAAVLAWWIGDVSMAMSVVVGLAVVLVFGVLMGMFWGAPVMAGGHGDDANGVPDAAQPLDAHHHSSVPVVSVLAEPVLPAIAQPARAIKHEAVAEVAHDDHVSPDGKPAGLAGPRDGKADALQTIEGIGPVLEKLCHDMGIYHFDQIAAWGSTEVAWMDTNLKGFRGRVTRDKWVAQAKLIGEVGLDAFKERAKLNDY